MIKHVAYIDKNKVVGYGQLTVEQQAITISGKTAQVESIIEAHVGQRVKESVDMEEATFKRLQDPKDKLTIKTLRVKDGQVHV